MVIHDIVVQVKLYLLTDQIKQQSETMKND